MNFPLPGGRIAAGGAQSAKGCEFGVAPADFADLYYDAASLLLRRLQSVATSVRGNLVIDRAALARAIRGTTEFRGVTCTVTLDPLTGNRLDDQAALKRCARS